jgi:hypothetical protein
MAATPAEPEPPVGDAHGEVVKYNSGYIHSRPPVLSVRTTPLGAAGTLLLIELP